MENGKRSELEQLELAESILKDGGLTPLELFSKLTESMDHIDAHELIVEMIENDVIYYDMETEKVKLTEWQMCA